jgi:hypothetical protein
MPYLKGNLHTHTKFSDGSRSPEEVIFRYKSMGYDFLAITDHHEMIPPEYWYRVPQKDGGLLIFVGVEIDYRPLGQHVNKIGGDYETLYTLNHPSRYRLSLDEMLRRIKILGTNGFPIHAVETTDKSVYHPTYDVPEIPYPKIATDDAHHDGEFGRAWIEVEARRKPDAILKAIKAGHFRMGFSEESPSSP